jgi:hypothetical protein
MKLRPYISVRWRLRLARREVVSLKREARTLKRLLAAEQVRNREREDELISRIATSRGTYGVSARVAPAYQSPRVAPVQPQMLPDLNNLNADEREEHAFWLRDAADHGVPATQATQDFLADLMRRRQPINEGEIG